MRPEGQVTVRAGRCERRRLGRGQHAAEHAFDVSHLFLAFSGRCETQLGRRPILAAGNSGGDREMLEWAQATGSPSLALLIDHDDAEREFHYTSTAQTFAETEPITDVGAHLGWTVVSMARDWDVIFPPESG